MIKSFLDLAIISERQYVLHLGTPGVLKKRLVFMEVVGLCILQRKGWSHKNKPGMWVRIPHGCRIFYNIDRPSIRA